VAPSSRSHTVRATWLQLQIHADPSAVVVKGGSHASPILLDSQVRSDCGSIRKHVRFAGFCG